MQEHREIENRKGELKMSKKLTEVNEKIAPESVRLTDELLK